MMNCNTPENISLLMDKVDELNEFKAMEVFEIVSNYNDRLSGYDKEDLLKEIEQFNSRYE